jgi:glycosyltransferase involved in cell wall biosynthesis
MTPAFSTPQPHQKMNSQRPLISVIMPTHNAERYIGKAIQSVLAQTYTHWELIIVDDASTDNTTNVVKGFVDARIRYQKIERIGYPAGVRNVALRMAQGEFIAFLDSDDLYYPDTLEKLSSPLFKNPDLISVYGFAFQVDENDNPVPNALNLRPNPNRNNESEPEYLPPKDYQHTWERIVTSQISCLLAALMLRRSAWEQIGFFNENLCGTEDYEFYVRMFQHHHAGVYCLSDYVYQYRIHSASLTKAPEHCQRLLESCLTIMRWLFEEVELPPSARALKSKAYLGCYRYLARERLLNHQPHMARALALKTFFDPNIHKKDALFGCGILLLRSFLPSQLDHWLVNIKRESCMIQIRQNKQTAGANV